MSKPREFYILLGCYENTVEAATWKQNGKKELYTGTWPRCNKGEKIILVREVKPRKRKKK